ncbi:MAG: hypothetical protein EBV03_10005 [Proteobacteria bacterium]|nr:hypothetical protein [Pseudomonadota bacterium]
MGEMKLPGADATPAADTAVDTDAAALTELNGLMQADSANIGAALQKYGNSTNPDVVKLVQQLQGVKAALDGAPASTPAPQEPVAGAAVDGKTGMAAAQGAEAGAVAVKTEDGALAAAANKDTVALAGTDGQAAGAMVAPKDGLTTTAEQQQAVNEILARAGKSPSATSSAMALGGSKI